MSTQTPTRKLTKLDSEQGMMVLLFVIVALSVAAVLVVGS